MQIATCFLLEECPLPHHLNHPGFGQMEWLPETPLICTKYFLVEKYILTYNLKAYFDILCIKQIIQLEASIY